MKWSWKVGRIGGVDLRVHATFVLLLAWLGLARYQATGSAGVATSGVLFTLAIFASVVLHELGHARMARRFGVATRDITLLPIGGVARLESMPEKPSQELAIALAGPAVTAAIALALYGAARTLGLPLAVPEQSMGLGGAFVVQLLWANVLLLGFNLLPAFPMDGGRVLRAALATRTSYERATELATRVGRTFALLFGAFGLLSDPILVLIALFVWLSAAGEAAAVQLRSALEGVPVERAMIRDVRTLEADDRLETALAHVLAGFQQDFPVLEDGRVVGVLTRAGMLRGLAREGDAGRVRDSMERSFRTAQAGEPLERAMQRMDRARFSTLPVLGDGELRGVLTTENVGEYVAIDAALRTTRERVRAERAARHTGREGEG